MTRQEKIRELLEACGEMRITVRDALERMAEWECGECYDVALDHNCKIYKQWCDCRAEIAAAIGQRGTREQD